MLGKENITISNQECPSCSIRKKHCNTNIFMRKYHQAFAKDNFRNLANGNPVSFNGIKDKCILEGVWYKNASSAIAAMFQFIRYVHSIRYRNWSISTGQQFHKICFLYYCHNSGLSPISLKAKICNVINTQHFYMNI